MNPTRAVAMSAVVGTLVLTATAWAQAPQAADTSASRPHPVVLAPLAVDVSGPEPVMRLSLAEFMAQVGRRNLDYAAQAFNVPIADAQVSVARLFPNPTLAWGTGVDVSGQHQATSYALSLTQTLL